MEADRSTPSVTADRGRKGKAAPPKPAPRFSFSLLASGKMIGHIVRPEIRWWEKAACRYTSDPDLWFPSSSSETLQDDPRTAQAIGICHCCEIKDKCLEYALEANETTGIWGGTTPTMRRRIKKDPLRRLA